MAQKTMNLSAGEVLEVIYTDDDPLLVYAIKVKIIDDQIGHDVDSPSTITAVPLNFNTIKNKINENFVVDVPTLQTYLEKN